jgi:CMP-2-keto-3-deoxyoctulosonic acid synthetase
MLAPVYILATFTAISSSHFDGYEEVNQLQMFWHAKKRALSTCATTTHLLV